MKPDYSKTYWNNKGNHPGAKSSLGKLIPVAGKVADHKNNPALEKYRIASNCYYDLYNNGLCNQAAEFRKVFGFSATNLTTRNVRGLGYQLTQELIDRTEIRMDEIILAAYAEQFSEEPDLRTTAKAFRDAVAKIDFSSLPSVYDSIPWADMDKVLAKD